MWIKLLSAVCGTLGDAPRLALPTRFGSCYRFRPFDVVAPLGVRVCSWAWAQCPAPYRLLRADGGSSGDASSNFCFPDFLEKHMKHTTPLKFPSKEVG